MFYKKKEAEGPTRLICVFFRPDPAGPVGFVGPDTKHVECPIYNKFDTSPLRVPNDTPDKREGYQLNSFLSLLLNSMSGGAGIVLYIQHSSAEMWRVHCFQNEPSSHI